MSFTSLKANYNELKLKKCSSFSNDQGTKAIRMQALQLWINDWIELSSELWSESTLCCHATARSMAVHTKHKQRTALYLHSLPQTFIIHLCLRTTGQLFFRGLQATLSVGAHWPSLFTRLCFSLYFLVIKFTVGPVCIDTKMHFSKANQMQLH